MDLPLSDAETDILAMLVVKEIHRTRHLGYSQVTDIYRLMSLRDKIERCRQQERTLFMPNYERHFRPSDGEVPGEQRHHHRERRGAQHGDGKQEDGGDGA